MHKRGLEKTVFAVVKKEKGRTVLLFSFIASSILLALFPPLILEKIVNTLIEGEMILLSMAILYFGILAISAFFDAAREVMITVFGQKITKQIRNEMAEKLNRLPAGYFSEHEAGKVTSQFVNDVDAVDSLFSNGIISMFTDVCKVFSIILIIFGKSLGLGVLMLFVTPLLFVMTRSFQKRMLKAQILNRIAVGKVNNHVPETIRNIRMIQSLKKQKYMEKRYDTYMEENYRAIEQSNLYDSIYSPIIIFISSLVISVMMILSAMGGEVQAFFGMSVGTAVAIIAYVGKVFEPLESIGMEIQNIQSAIAGVKRINEFLDEKERTPQTDTVSDEKKEVSISFQQVSFGYDAEQKILEEVSFDVKEGEKVTIAGRTGVGKSTIFKLLLGLYQPWSGSVCVYGKNPFFLAEEDKRGLFGYVEQNFKLVPGTIAEQITLFDEKITLQQVKHAAKLVGLHEMIEKTDKGYETKVEEAFFSQGQLQLLSIARAVVCNPKILLLDEITANLDSDTERAVLRALERASENRTVLSISHRLYEQECNRVILSFRKL